MAARRKSRLSAKTNARRNTKAGRAKMKPSSFGLPGKKKYRLDDAAHAKNAKSRATQQYKKGKLSKSAMQQVHAKANRVLKKKK